MKLSGRFVDGDDGMTYLHLRGNCFLRLGDKSEVHEATPEKLGDIIKVQWAFAQYNEILDSYGIVRH